MSSHDVLVVGAGPAGLTAAATLAHAGVRTLLVERRHEPSPLPRATTISTRSMEILRSYGLEDAVRAGGNEVEWILWRCETLAQVADGEGFVVGLPTNEQSLLVSPTRPGSAPQDHLERVLIDHVAGQDGATVERGTELVHADVGPGGVLAELRDVDTGATRIAHARYLVAADGAYSRIRKSLGIGMLGPERLVSGVTALFRAPLWERLEHHRYGLFGIMRADASAAFLPCGPDDRWGWGFLVPQGEERELTEPEIVDLVLKGVGDPDLPLELERTGTFTAGAQLAERFRHQSAFLVGDAAHRVTPRGGTGMNTAIHDGYDLGWKLAWAIRGWAGDDLLDTYEAERRPVAAHNVERSADPDGSVRDVASELRADLGGRLPHVWVGGQEHRVSTLDLLGPGLTMFTGPDGAEPPRGLGRAPLAVHRLDEISARGLGIRGRGALVVRPDGTPAAWPYDLRAVA